MITIRVMFDNLVTDDEITADYSWHEIPKDADGKLVNIFLDVEKRACEYTRTSNGCLSTDNYEIVAIEGDAYDIRKAFELELERNLESFATSEMIELHNAICERGSYWENYYNTMRDFDEFNQGKTPTEIVNAIASGFDTSADFFVDGIYGYESKDADCIWTDFDYTALAYAIISGDDFRDIRSCIGYALDDVVDLASKIE